MSTQTPASERPSPWNKGKLIGQKAPLRISEIWAIRVRLEIYGRRRDLALFNLAIDSKLRGCDLVQLRVHDVCHGNHVTSRATVMQQKTKHLVQFEMTAGTRKSLVEWISSASLEYNDYLFPSRIGDSPHISTRQYARTCTSGSKKSVSIQQHIVRIRCAEPSQPSFIAARRT